MSERMDEAAMQETATSTSSEIKKTDPRNDSQEWKGNSMIEIHKGFGVYDCPEHPSISPSSEHTVLFFLPFCGNGPPRPFPRHQMDKWGQGYVRMPYSSHNVCPVNQESGGNKFQSRWELIKKTLLRSIMSSHELQTAILSYNQMYAQTWDFVALHNFFSEVVDEEESKMFFEGLMPKMIQLALQLPTLITGSIPLLKRHTNGCISLSQLQVASLLANAFFCTFPRRNSTNPQSEYGMYPYINFNRLFSAFKEERHDGNVSVMEKLKCIFHYFRRVTTKAPEGVITIERRYIPPENCPKWEQQNKKLPHLHVTSKGTIETEGAGLLQVDFANKFVGGGVLGTGCVQEEIRFVICPELMITMLIAEVLDNTEALVISGVERYSKYEGYSNNFKWDGDFIDETPRDSSGRRMTSVVAIDALYFKQSSMQFDVNNIVRELNKAFVGFIGSKIQRNNLPAIATGNWGCGAFHGDPKLKILIQLMAAAISGRSVVYFTFGDTNLRDEVASMYWHLIQHNVDVGKLFSILVNYRTSGADKYSDFYRFLYNKINTEDINRTDVLKRKSNFPIFKERSNVRRFYSSTKEKEIADEMEIERLLMSIDEDELIAEKMEIDNTGIKQTDEPNKFIENSEKNGETLPIVKLEDDVWYSVEKKSKRVFEHISDKSEVTEKRLSGLDLLDKRETPVINCNINTNNSMDAAKPQLINSNELNNSSQKSSNDNKVIFRKKNTQRSISEFLVKRS